MKFSSRCFVFGFLQVLLPMNSAGLLFHPQMPPPSSLARQLQDEAKQAGPVSTEFELDEDEAVLLTNESGEDLANFAAFLEALMTSAIASSAPPFDANWSSTVGHGDVPGNDDDDTEVGHYEGSAFKDAGFVFTPSPTLSSGLVGNSTSASSSRDDAAAAGINAGDEASSTDGGDANMAHGEMSSSTAPPQLSISVAAAITTLSMAFLVLAEIN